MKWIIVYSATKIHWVCKIKTELIHNYVVKQSTMKIEEKNRFAMQFWCNKQSQKCILEPFSLSTLGAPCEIWWTLQLSAKKGLSAHLDPPSPKLPGELLCKLRQKEPSNQCEQISCSAIKLQDMKDISCSHQSFKIVWSFALIILISRIRNTQIGS